MKTCEKCGESSPIENFEYHSSYKDDFFTICKKCYDKIKLEKDAKKAERLEKKNQTKEKNKLKKKEAQKRISEKHKLLKLKLIEEKGSVCLDCNKSYPIVCYDFHHRDKTSKEYGWGQLKNKSEEIIRAEIEKCDLLCSNCHRIRHQ
jgi:hypothetical protein